MKSIYILLIFVANTLCQVYEYWPKQIIDAESSYGVFVEIEDLDNDGDLDAVSVAYHGSKLSWYENIGLTPLSWTRHVIDSNITEPVGVSIIDIDGDNRLDIAVTSYSGVWLYKNDGGTPPGWTKSKVGQLSGAEGMCTADFDKDGDIDIAASSWDVEGKCSDQTDVAWFENRLPENWLFHPIDNDRSSTSTIVNADFDNDQDMDLIVAGNHTDQLILYRNNLPDPWTIDTVDNYMYDVFGVQTVDLDGDSLLDIIAAGPLGNTVNWYKNINNGEDWIEYPIDNDLGGARLLWPGYINKDDKPDIVVGANSKQMIVYYENHLPGPWIMDTINTNIPFPNYVNLSDIDKDGDPDVFVTSQRANNLVWLENLFMVARPKKMWRNSAFIGQNDSLKIYCNLKNPENHPALVKAVITGQKSGFTDSIPLYDDGLHDDGDALDNMFGGSSLLAEYEQDFYQIKLKTTDMLEDTSVFTSGHLNFTNIGPLIADDIFLVGDDTVANPGDRLRIKFILANKSKTDSIYNVTSRTVALDTSFSRIIPFSDPKYGDIEPTKNAEGNRPSIIQLSADCPAPSTQPFLLKMYSNGYSFWSDTFWIDVEVDTVSTSLANSDKNIPKEFVLNQNHPNPFNPKTIINYELPVRSAGGAMTSEVDLSIYNLLGQKVATLVNEKQTAGTYKVEWDASAFNSGIYFYRLQTDKGFSQTRKLIVLK